MSVVIGVCSTNFCLFAADTRRVTARGDSLVFDNDSTQKIFKINQNVLFGATGLFGASEALLDPLAMFPSPDMITVSNAQNATSDYTRHCLSKLSVRNYLIGGKEDSGEFSIRYLHYNGENRNIDIQVFKPTPPYAYAFVCALPADLNAESIQYQNLVGQLINRCTTIPTLVEGLAQIIRDISDRDSSVGKEVVALLVT